MGLLCLMVANAVLSVAACVLWLCLAMTRGELADERVRRAKADAERDAERARRERVENALLELIADDEDEDDA